MGVFSESTEEELSSLEAIYSDEIKIKRCFQCSEQGQTPWIADIVYKLTPAVVDEARDEITVQVKIPRKFPISYLTCLRYLINFYIVFNCFTQPFEEFLLTQN